MSYELWWDISMRPGDAPQRTPDLIACFNAGVWGYSEWQPAVKLMLQHSGKSPVVFTAYNALECDADEEVVDRVAAGIATEKGAEVGTGEPWYAWNATRNPWRSLAPRPSSMHPGETLFESYYCFALREGTAVGAGEPWYAWNATRNPWRSLVPRPSSMHPGETLFDSYYCFALRWQDQTQPPS
eukprot:gene12923-19929_t